MKYDAQRSFGYPVLRGNLDDYAKGSFQPSISPQRKQVRRKKNGV